MDRLASGEIIAVWEAGYNQDGSLNGVFGRKIGLDGTLGEEIQINQTTARSQSNPGLVATSDGGAVVVWNGDGRYDDSRGTYGRHIDADGSLGDEFMVDSGASGVPRIAEISDGLFAVTWLTDNSSPRDCLLYTSDAADE